MTQKTAIKMGIGCGDGGGGNDAGVSQQVIFVCVDLWAWGSRTWMGQTMFAVSLDSGEPSYLTSAITRFACDY